MYQYLQKNYLHTQLHDSLSTGCAVSNKIISIIRAQLLLKFCDWAVVLGVDAVVADVVVG